MARKQKNPNTSAEQASPKDRILEAGLALAAIQDWGFVTVRDIAGEAGVSLSDFYQIFESRDDVIHGCNRKLDQKVLASFEDFDPETSVRDRLFDILMERFDLANQNRAAWISIFKSYARDPKYMICGLPALSVSMTRMLEAAGIESNGYKGAARVTGLTLGYIYILREWLDDETADLTKTMAALDKLLNRFENIANTINL